MSPDSEVKIHPRGDRGILAAVEAAGVDPRMQNLLLHSEPGAQQDVMRTMLHRMAALEQRQRDAESANANAWQAMASGVFAQYSHVPLWDREFEAKMDAVTYVHFEDHRLPATAEGAKCLDTTCSRIPPKGAKFCQCGAPASFLDLKCQHPTCGHPVMEQSVKCLIGTSATFAESHSFTSCHLIFVRGLHRSTGG